VGGGDKSVIDFSAISQAGLKEKLLPLPDIANKAMMMQGRNKRIAR